MPDEKYYVYVYIDPRNFEAFYYGKGKGNRIEAHMKDTGKSEKAQIIQAILKEGLEPIRKIIAKNLTEKEALLVEKTLIWKLGKGLSNKSGGHFTSKFRPHNSFHKNLFGFDYEKGIYYVNVGEDQTRDWEDCKKLGYLTAGGGLRYSDSIRTLNKGDVVVAYLKNNGYVGVGVVKEQAVKASEFMVKGRLLSTYDLKKPGLFERKGELAEWAVGINWKKTVSKENAFWKSKSGLFTSQIVKASLEKQPKTVKFVENAFDVNFQKLLRRK